MKVCPIITPPPLHIRWLKQQRSGSGRRHLDIRVEEVCSRMGRWCDAGGSGRQRVECAGVVMCGIVQCLSVNGFVREGVHQNCLM